MFGCHSNGQRKCIQCKVVHAQGQVFLQLYQKWDTGAVKGNCMQNESLESEGQSGLNWTPTHKIYSGRIHR